MGMYDTFGSSGDQLQIFSVPCYYFNQERYDRFKETGEEYSFLGFMGGMLNNYPIGSNVPWRTLYYNYSPNFTVVDIGYESFPTMLYGFSNGKLLTITEYDENKLINYKHLFRSDRIVINGSGTFLTIRDVNMLRDYIISDNEEHINRIKIMRKFGNIQKCLFNYIKLIKDDPNLETEINNSSTALSDLDYIETQAYRKNRQHLRSYFQNSLYHYDYSMYGGYIDTVEHYSKKYDLDDDIIPALMHEAKEHIENNVLSLDEFFNWNNTQEKDKEWITAIDKKIRGWGD